jgi:N-methylhydantoinase A
VVRGPAIIEDDISTIVLPPGTAAEADQFGHLHINIHDGEDREDQQ